MCGPRAGKAYDLVACAGKFLDAGGAGEAYRAGNENTHGHSP